MTDDEAPLQRIPMVIQPTIRHASFLADSG
jgi:hypothetical protein